jgi:hypothetical protein
MPHGAVNAAAATVHSIESSQCSPPESQTSIELAGRGSCCKVMSSQPGSIIASLEEGWALFQARELGIAGVIAFAVMHVGHCSLQISHPRQQNVNSYTQAGRSAGSHSQAANGRATMASCRKQSGSACLCKRRVRHNETIYMLRSCATVRPAMTTLVSLA